MLDQLVESKSTAREDTRRGGFMMTTFIIMITVLVGAWIYSLFNKNYGDAFASDLELSTLVAPVPVPEDEPPPPKPENEPKKQTEVKETNVDVRKELIQNIMESPTVPPKINTEKTDAMARRIGALTKIGDRNSDAAGVPSGPTRTVDPGSGGGIVKETAPPVESDNDEPPPPPPPKPTPKPVPKTISGGVVNGKAISLPAPPYPAAAKAVGAKGSVTVQVLIDENGNVVSARAASGHPLLRPSAEQAARRAKFKPTELSGQPVKVSGVITYVFN
ncbi:MAG: energy transducer TonB [Pyrinomonadaceae bacterium]